MTRWDSGPRDCRTVAAVNVVGASRVTAETPGSTARAMNDSWSGYCRTTCSSMSGFSEYRMVMS